jgi:tetratricopeptide (TPR) repeat protein
MALPGRYIDPMWWVDGEFEGQRMRDILARRDIGTVLRFVNRRGLSRSYIVAVTGMTETAVRECWQGRRRVEKYEVLERIADGLRIPRGFMGLAYADDSGFEEGAPALVLAATSEPADYMSLVAGLAMGAGPSRKPISSMMHPARLPDIVTIREIEVLREMTSFHRRYDAEFGGGACRDSAAAYLTWAMGMLEVRCTTDAVRKGLLAALSDLHQVVGWACHDLGDHSAARGILIDALALARRAEDLPLVAGALYRLGRVSIHQDRAAEALRMWQLGQIAAQDSGCLISAAVLHANEAWAYARLGDDLRVKDALARAEAERRRANGAVVPGWAGFFTMPADLTGMTGLVFSTLAAHTAYRERYAGYALAACDSSLNDRRPEEGRSRVLDMIGVAGAYLLNGDVEAALRFGLLAVDATAEITSHRAVDRLRDVVDLGANLGMTHELVELSERVESLALRTL